MPQSTCLGFAFLNILTKVCLSTSFLEQWPWTGMRKLLRIPSDFRHWASCHKHGGHLCVYFERCPFRSLHIFYCIIYLSAVKLWEVFLSFNMISLPSLPDMWLTYMFWWLLDHCPFILLIVLQFDVLCPFCFFFFFCSLRFWWHVQKAIAENNVKKVAP